MIPMFSFPIPATSPIPAAPATPPVPAGRLQILLLCLAGAARTGRSGRLHVCRSLVWGILVRRLYSGQRAAGGIPGYSKARHTACPLLLFCGIGVFALTARLRRSTHRPRLLRVLVVVPGGLSPHGANTGATRFGRLYPLSPLHQANHLIR